MKAVNLIPLAFFAIVMLLGSCTEEIFIDRVVYDTVPGPIRFVPTFVQTSSEAECVETDTLDVEVVFGTTQNGTFAKDTAIRVSTACYALIKIRGYILVPEDSILVPGPIQYLPGDSILVPGDSILVPGPIQYLPGEPYPVYDTVWQTKVEQRVIHKDTLYYPIYTRPINSVPDEFKPFVSDFYSLAGSYGRELTGGVMIISYVHEDDLPGEGWNSHSYWVGGSPYGQMVIEVNESIPSEQHRASILRELNRLQLKGKYTIVPDRIMNPLFPPAETITTNHLNVLFANPMPI